MPIVNVPTAAFCFCSPLLADRVGSLTGPENLGHRCREPGSGGGLNSDLKPLGEYGPRSTPQWGPVRVCVFVGGYAA